MSKMHMSYKNRLKVGNVLKVLLSLIFGGLILYWMYRKFDFRNIGDFMLYKMDWMWMFISFPFGILAQMFRGWRWKQTLEPVGETCRARTLINSIYLSYAVSLIIPRIGEFARCGVLSSKDGVSFPKALGTVFMERIIDMLLILIITGVVLFLQINVFGTFFDKTGVSIDSIFYRFTEIGWIVTGICFVTIIVVILFLLKKFSVHHRISSALHSIVEGLVSLKYVKNKPLFFFFTLAIWVSYFLHFYLTFYCFEFTKDLGLMCALVCFIVGSIAVIVPTPNGAGPWHFAVKTMLVLYGVVDTDALYFVLIVHTVQTLLVVLLGIYSAIYMSITK